MSQHSDETQRELEVLGVTIRDTTMDEAVSLLGRRIERGAVSGETHHVFYVNAHSLNCAIEDPEYRAVLEDGDLVFGDGTGVRWAARMKGVRLQDNLNGTDMTPALLRRYADRGWRYFLLGSTPEIIERAAERCQRELAPGWVCAGYRHGYVDPEEEAEVVQQINEAQPHLLLVGMGNPLQEKWIHRNRRALRVPLAMGIGGLFHYFADDMPRAPRWVRAMGMEWAYILLQQPKKARRYLLGNPLFLVRAIADRWNNGPAVQRLPMGR